MTGAMDTGLDFYRTVLAVRDFRQELLTADIANASTPGFKAIDLDFKAALAASLGDSPAVAPGAAAALLVDDPRHMSSGGDARGAAMKRAIRYQVGGPVTLDGNSIDLNQEKLLAAENAVDYEAAVTFTTQTLNLLLVAVKGSGASKGG